jgi:hypothetical protein
MKAVMNVGIKLYNKNQIELGKWKKIRQFKRDLRSYLLQHTFYSVDECCTCHNKLDEYDIWVGFFYELYLYHVVPWRNLAKYLCYFQMCVLVRRVPCHHSMACPQVANGGNALQIWRVAAKILNKQLRTADKGWSSSLGVGCGANNSSP